MNADDEQRARTLLRSAARGAPLSPDPYGRLMRRIRRRHRAKLATISGLAMGGVAAAAIVPAQLAGRHTSRPTTSPQSISRIQSTTTPMRPTPSRSKVSGTRTAVITTQADAVRQFMETNAAFTQAILAGMPGSGRLYCGVTILGHSATGGLLYVYFTCVQFVSSGGTLQQATGTSAPALLHVEGAGSQMHVLSWRLPRDGSLYVADVKQMFPAAVADEVLQHAAGVVPSQEPLRTRAQADLDNGLL